MKPLTPEQQRMWNQLQMSTRLQDLLRQIQTDSTTPAELDPATRAILDTIMKRTNSIR